MKLIFSSIMVLIALTIGVLSSSVTCASTNLTNNNITLENDKALPQVKKGDKIYKKKMMSKHLVKMPKLEQEHIKSVEKNYSLFEEITFLTDNLQNWLASFNNSDKENDITSKHAMCS